MMGGGRPVPFGVSFLPSSPILPTVSMSPEFNGAKKFHVGTDVAGFNFGGLFSPVTFLFFRFLSGNPSGSSAKASVGRGLFVWGVCVFRVLTLDYLA